MACFDKAKLLLEFNRAVQPKLTKIIEPLKLLGISNFAYVKYTKDNETFRVGNHNAYTDMWFKQEVYKKPATLNRLSESGTNPDSRQLRCYLWNADNTDLTQLRRDVNMWHGASFYLNRGDYIEGWALGGTLEDHALPNFILNNQEAIKLFFHYFRSAASDLIDTSDKSKILLKPITTEPALTENMCNSEDVAEFLRQVALNKYFLRYGNENFTLTARELDCLRLKDHGYSAKEIARLIDISYRTVETYLDNIKIKSGLRNISQVLAVCKGEGLL